jgi:hypothetical protein
MNRSLLPLLFALLAACRGASVPSAATPSPYFDDVGENLELGGEVFVYADVDGDAEHAADFLLQILGDAPELGGLAATSRLHGASLARALGLDHARAIGLSSVEDGSRYRNRGFIALAERDGLFRVWGDAPRGFDVLDMAAADADLVWQQEVDADALVDLARALGKLGLGIPPDDLDALLDDPLSGLNVTARELVDDLTTTLRVVSSVDESRNVWLPGQSFTFPHTDFVIAVDGISSLTEAFVRYAAGDPFVRAERSDTWVVVTPSIRLPPPWNAYEPALMMDTSTGRTFVVSSPRFLQECLGASNRLRATATFAETTSALPTDGNSFIYLSPRITRVMHAALDKVVAAQGPAIQTHVARALLPTASEPYAWVLRNQPNGVLFRSNSASSHKSTLVTFGFAALLPALLLLDPPSARPTEDPL